VKFTALHTKAEEIWFFLGIQQDPSQRNPEASSEVAASPLSVFSCSQHQTCLLTHEASVSSFWLTHASVP